MDKLILVLTDYGIWGILVLSSIDSFIPLPNVVDGLILFIAYRNHDPFTPAIMATIGSAVGTFFFFIMVRSGRNFVPFGKRTKKRLDKVTDWLGKYDFLTIVGAAALPPPFPLKAVVISAGLLRFSIPRFILAFTAGRAIRYFTESIFAVLYGEAAIEVVEKHYPLIALMVVSLSVFGFVLFRFVIPRLRNGRKVTPAA